MVRIGHASINENGSITGGAAGDQNGKEVCIRSWYQHKKSWVVLRAKDPDKAERMAAAMERACNNPDIGYCQNRRYSLFNDVKAFGWDPAKTTKKVHCDCSSLIQVVGACAWGYDVFGNIRTISMPTVIPATGLFEKLTDPKYTESPDYLRRGDILVTPVSGHTVMVLDNGEKVAPAATTTKNTKATEPARLGPSASRSRTYKTTCNLCIRNGAGTKANKYGKDKHVLTKAPKGTKVRCHGYYTKVGQYEWLLVEATIDGVKYTGFCSKAYLQKV